MTDKQNAGRKAAFTDWIKGGFSNPFQEGSEEYTGYEKEKNLIEIQNDLQSELAGRLGL